jgi:hypothetical protein
LAAFVAGGCFTPDLGDGQVACGSGGICPPDYVCRSDQHCWKATGGDGDLGMTTGADLAITPEPCTAAGMRVCADSGHSAVCSAAAVAPTLDRTCPPSSICASGHCQPPAGAVMCKKSADCTNGTVCTPFVVGAVVDTRCAPPLPGAAGGSGSSCSATGFDTTCKSGYCARVGSNNLCETPCNNQNDCGGNNCDNAMLTVEGTTAGALKSCNN